MKSLVERLNECLERILSLSEDLIINHCAVSRKLHALGTNAPITGERIPNIYKNVLHVKDEIGREVLQTLNDEYETLSQLSHCACDRGEMAKLTLCCRLQTKDGATYPVDMKATSAINNYVKSLRDVVAKLKDDWPITTLLSVDTNALIANPDLEAWTFPDFDRFTIVLTPTVLSELDNLKNGNRNEQLRQKAAILIRKIKEYGRRGDWQKGVTVKRGITLMLLPNEPGFEHAPWLDPTVNDDRIIARTINLIHAHPKCAVALVTGDVNVQNKAKHARIEYLEPPEPTTTATASPPGGENN